LVKPKLHNLTESEDSETTTPEMLTASGTTHS